MFDEWLKIAGFLVVVAIIIMSVCAHEGPIVWGFALIVGVVIWQAFHTQRGYNKADINRRRRRR